MTDDGAYDDGHAVGRLMARQRARGDFSYDARYDLAAAARCDRLYFCEFKRGLEDALGERYVYWTSDAAGPDLHYP